MEPDQFHGGSDSLRLPVHAEVVQAQEAAQENAGLFVTRYHDGIRRGPYVAAHGPRAGTDPVEPPKPTSSRASPYF